MHTRLQKDYRKMKKISATILASAMTLALFAGCGQKISETDVSVTSSETQATATAATTAETSAQATEETFEDVSFEDYRGTQLLNYLDHQYYFDGEPLPKAETNLQFIIAFEDMRNDANMGYYELTPDGMYVDLSASYPDKEYDTLGDYLVKKAEDAIAKTCILCKRAEAEGVKLTEDHYSDIELTIESFRKQAESFYMSLEDFIQLYVGPGYTESDFRKAFERYSLSIVYEQNYCDNYKFSDAEINTPYLTGALFYAPDSAEQEKKDEALKSAQSMKDACKNVDDIITLAEENGTANKYGYIVVIKGQGLDSEIEDWACSPDRKAGDIEILHSSEMGYYVVGYRGIESQITYTPYIRYALFSAPEEADQAVKDQALKDAESMKNACTNLDDFKKLATQAADLKVVAEFNDMVVSKDQTVPAFDSWAFDANRKEGEIDVIYAPEYGYFVVGFLGMKEVHSDILNSIARNKLKSSYLEEYNSGKYELHTDDEFLPAPAAPTPTDIPVQPTEEALPSGSETAAATETIQATPVPEVNPAGQSATNVLVVVFITLAAVAIAAVVVILISHTVRNSKNPSEQTFVSGGDDAEEDEEDKGSAEEDSGDPDPEEEKTEDDESSEDEDKKDGE